MSLQDKVGQLVLVKTKPSREMEDQKQKLNQWFTQYKLGGVIFDGHTLEDQYNLALQYQAVSKTPLIIGMYNNPMESRFVRGARRSEPPICRVASAENRQPPWPHTS